MIRVQIEIDTDGASWSEECTRVVDVANIESVLGEMLETAQYWPYDQQPVLDTNGNRLATVTLDKEEN